MLRPLLVTFAAALSRFGKGMKEDHLQKAYKRAGTALRGQMQQHFMVLRDDVGLWATNR
jgi:hypothetical protein